MPRDFYGMTFGHYLLYEHGYRIRQAREWERTRYLASIILASQGVAKNPVDLMPLITDIMPIQKTVAELKEEQKRLFALMETFKFSEN